MRKAFFGGWDRRLRDVFARRKTSAIQSATDERTVTLVVIGKHDDGRYVVSEMAVPAEQLAQAEIDELLPSADDRKYVYTLGGHLTARALILPPNADEEKQDFLITFMPPAYLHERIAKAIEMNATSPLKPNDSHKTSDKVVRLVCRR